MKPAYGYALLLPRALHRLTMRMPAIDSNIYWGYPVFPRLADARLCAAEYAKVGLDSSIVRVEIREFFDLKRHEAERKPR